MFSHLTFRSHSLLETLAYGRTRGLGNSSNPSFGDGESTCKNTTFAGADVENMSQKSNHHHNIVRIVPALVINDVAQVIANLEVHHA